MIKVIFFDVDGTLLSHKLNTVPESTRASIAQIREKGIKTVIATGRHMIELSKLPEMDLNFDGFLTLNGQLILDSAKKLVMGTAINRGEMEIISRIFQAHRIPFMLIGEDHRYINYVNELVEYTQNSTKGTIPDIGQYQGEDIYQCIAFVPAHEKNLLTNILDECSVVSWNETGIDIIPKGGGKAVGIQQFLNAYGIDRSEIMAFGDGDNDIEMLKYAGIGVAMGNASDAVKAAADYVTTPIDENGISNALRHFGLID